MRRKNSVISSGELGGFRKMKQSQIVGKIDPILKVRIDKIQHQINFIDDQYALNGIYRQSFFAVRDALVERKEMLLKRI